MVAAMLMAAVALPAFDLEVVVSLNKCLWWWRCGSGDADGAGGGSPHCCCRGSVSPDGKVKSTFEQDVKVREAVRSLLGA